MLKQTIFAAAVAVSAPVTSAAQDTEMLRVGISEGYYPFTFVRQDELQGFGVDLMNAVGEEADLGIEIETLSANDLAGALEAGEIDTIASPIEIFSELKSVFALSQPYIVTGAQIVTREGNDDIDDVRDLQGKKVAVNPGTYSEHLLRNLPFAEHIDIHVYQGNMDYDTALGRMDAFVMNQLAAAKVIQRSPLPLEPAGQLFSENPIALPFRDTDRGRALRDRIDEALTNLKEDGTIAEISRKWFDANVAVPAPE